ncbi:hypothetical protein MPTK1_5g14570 [Marchantia polymorpha subsp. ruderalis]|uniref:Uncharacterized protein n=2 Tax=Marchantia polymorpha TaxID=3197 RepID=A0AAF6BID5_MARPO|nr:hypothetical protein MARPO_0032s0149 [Marchantia polymorpha]BBN11769.1 hypothetical protein Mp_5g14570 [Marchantia polymorpha subsp. ruderalis]|eukprot:PTQ41987.1 hypothetical protein MARPO_0032s0149 [Marchantia polymorpha]
MNSLAAESGFEFESGGRRAAGMSLPHESMGEKGIIKALDLAVDLQSTRNIREFRVDFLDRSESNHPRVEKEERFSVYGGNICRIGRKGRSSIEGSSEGRPAGGIAGR